MEKRCKLCKNSFSYFSETNDYLCNNNSLDNVTLKTISKLFDHCLCKKCINFLQKQEFPQLNNHYTIFTKKGKFKITIKKKSDFIIKINYEKYRYDLFEEKFSDLDSTLKNYFIYVLKLNLDDYSLIKNFEALDEHYRRIFTRVKYELLFY